MLKKWKNEKIIARNRADFLRFAHLRSKALSLTFTGLSPFADVVIEEGQENAYTANSERGFSEGSVDFSDDPPRTRLQLLRDWLLIYFRLS